MFLNPSQFLQKLAILTFIFAVSGSVNALEKNDDTWTFEIVPYLWATNMNGSVQIAQRRGSVSQSFSEILSDLDAGGMLWLSAKKDGVGVFLNSLYVQLSQDSNVGPFTATAQSNMGIFAGGVSFEAYHHPFANSVTSMTLEPYFGGRYTSSDNTLKIAGFSFSENRAWVDPIIGTRLRLDFNRCWLALFAADVGGINLATQKSYDLNAFLGYKPQTVLTNSTWYAGYRVLYQDYVTGSGVSKYVWDMRLFGPVLGVSFGF